MQGYVIHTVHGVSNLCVSSLVHVTATRRTNGNPLHSAYHMLKPLNHFGLTLHADWHVIEIYGTVADACAARSREGGRDHCRTIVPSQHV